MKVLVRETFYLYGIIINVLAKRGVPWNLWNPLWIRHWLVMIHTMEASRGLLAVRPSRTGITFVNEKP